MFRRIKMIVTEEEKLIFYKEISAASPINNVVISNIDFEEDEAYKFEWALNIKPLSGEQCFVFIEINGTRNAYAINEGGFWGTPNTLDVSQKAIPDAMALGTGYTTPYDQPTSGYVTFYKHPDRDHNGYGHSFVGEKMHDDGHHYITHILGGTIDQAVGPITNIGFVGDGTGSGTVTWYGWIKASKV